jgi:hypothetical protein
MSTTKPKRRRHVKLTEARVCRCGESEIRVYREANGYHVECANRGCSHFVWSAGTRNQALAEWNMTDG